MTDENHFAALLIGSPELRKRHFWPVLRIQGTGADAPIARFIGVPSAPHYVAREKMFAGNAGI